MIHLYIEHLLNIKTLSIQASLSTVSNKETKATLSADGKELTLSHEDETASIQLPINISPNRKSNVKFTIPAIPSKELSFRVQLEEKPGVQNGVLSNGDADSGNLVPWSAGSLTAEAEVCCARCSSVVVERGHIQTWKDLPSQGWAEMMEFWHCHKPHEPHDHGEGEMKKGYAADSKLAVEGGVGLVDVVDFLFASENCKNVTKSPPESGDESEPVLLQCTHCSAYLGTVEDATGGYQLHKPYLSTSPHPTQTPTSYPKTKWLTCQILTEVESQGVRKFTIQTPGPRADKNFKIWVLTPDLTVSSSAAPSSEPVRTMKVLWHASDVDGGNEGEMRTFLTESELKLGKDEAEALMGSLQTNSRWIPEGARELQGWNVGLLERFHLEDFAQWTGEVCIRRFRNYSSHAGTPN